MRKAIVILFFFVACSHEATLQQWPSGKIPFIMIGFTAEEEMAIVKAMIIWEVVSDMKVEFLLVGVSDIPKNTQVLQIIHQDGDTNFCVNTGYDPSGENIMGLAIMEERFILHELGHILGLMHEMCRPDRDLYISITLDLVADDLDIVWQFIYRIPELYDYSKYPFDYQSIMMYPSDQFEDIIDGHGQELGGDMPTWIDAWKVRDIYAENVSL